MSDMSYPTKENTKFMIVQGGEKKVMKKILSVALSTAMAFSMFASVAFGETATTPEAQFTALAAKGILTGYPDGQAHLEKDLTRAEFAKIIAKLLDLKEVTTSLSFKDKNYTASHWARGYIEAVNAAGLMTGKTATTFDPSGKVTVQEVATVLVRALKLDVPTTTDNTASDWAKGYVQAALNNKLLVAGTNFKANATRAQVVSAAYATDLYLSAPAVASTEAVSPTSVVVTFADKTTTTVTLTTALVEGVETPITFNYNGFTIKTKVTLLATKVVSVGALNAKQVEVKFNRAIDEATAIDVANYKVDDQLLATFDATATVAKGSDDRSVVITFTNPQNKTSFDLTVANVKSFDKTQTIATYKGVVTVNDTVAPAVSKVEYTSAGKVVVTFSEPMNTTVTPIVRVNGTPVTAAFVSGSQTKVEATVTIAKGATATIYVSGAKDSVNNEMAIYNSTVTAPNDTVAPAISSVSQVGQNKVKVVLTEALGSTAGYELANNELKFLVGSTVYSSTAAVLDTTDTTNKTYTVTFTETDIYGSSDPVNTKTGTLILDKDAVKDAYGNGNAAYSQTFTFNADKTGPAFVSGKVSSDKQTFELTFNEEFLGTASDVDQSKIVITDANGVRFNAIDATTIVKAGSDNTKILVVDFVAAAGLIENGTYTVQLQAGAVKDAKLNASSAASTTITVGNGSDTTKPTVTLGTSTVNQYVVNFSEEVTATALNLSNYKLDGNALPTGTVVYFNSTAKNSVTIELPANSVNIGNASTGTDALVTVSNVADKAGNVIDSTNLTVKIGDNTPATLQSAQKIGNTLILTFSEDLHADAADAVIADVLANYTIKADSTTVVAGTGAASASLVAGSNNKVQITFTSTTGTNFDSSKVITVTTKSAGDLKDANGVAVKADVTVTAN
jgi:hypothetical protein